MVSLNFFASGLLGRLGWSAVENGWIAEGGAATLVVGILAIVGLLFYFKKWKWLYREWLTTTDHKKIGVMYLIVALVMLLRGGVDALMMRAQQSVSVGSNNGFLSADHFQQVVSAHGTIMIFFVAMGLMFGLINVVIPLQLGSRDVAFPRLNAASFWLFFAGMALINLSLIVGQFAATGWLAYPPLSELAFSPGVGVDYWIWSLEIAGIGSLLAGINFFVTILRMRAKGMTLMKMPMFSWSVLGSMSLVIFAFPILTVTLTLLFLDRFLGMHFFTAGAGGNAMMYVNLIWAWGHPEVYILILPAFGIYSEVVATFARKRLFGYTSMVYAIWAIVVLSFLVWLHHFFTMGAGADVNGFFGIMTMVIAVPTGVKVFNWLFTLYRGRIHYATPIYWFYGFLVTFTIGGVAGVLMGVPPIDFQLHNSLFLVAHFHTMIIGGVVYGFFAGLTYWFPKIFGFKLNERLGRYAFWCWLVGFVLAFGPLYILGLMGATRRLNHYEASLGWQPLFIVAGVGAVIIACGVAFQALQFIVSFIKREHPDVTGDPWNGRTLEWSTASPAPVYNFAIEPVVDDRDAFWAMKQHPDVAQQPHYEAIAMPKNTPLGLLIAGGSFVVGFALIWHILWLGVLGFVFAIACLVAFTTDDDTEYEIPAAQVGKIEAAAAAYRKGNL
jgi:cytochrome o ubiquinol oxidase subunit 1